jgi:hypothetical protein
VPLGPAITIDPFSGTEKLESISPDCLKVHRLLNRFLPRGHHDILFPEGASGRAHADAEAIILSRPRLAQWLSRVDEATSPPGNLEIS